MSTSHTEIIVAARGWSYDNWLDNFYPDDLPEDWQLAYYSNEFRAVVVPARELAALDALEVERWVEDTPGEFEFYLEVEDLLIDWDAFVETVKPLGGQLRGILLRPVEVDEDLAMIASSLDAATSQAPVCVLLPEDVGPSQAGRDLLQQHGVELCWNADEGEPGWRGGGFTVARVTGNKHYTPREWRETIEACLRCENTSGDKRRVLLMVEQERPDPDALRAAMMIGDMLVIPEI
ncbi:MAG TPA: DUF72 domain-containing protein [Gammaproteobacteria bacterium]|nr:DUF72 domain-containing protein [Gammaproteobacteria bacterium]